MPGASGKPPILPRTSGPRLGVGLVTRRLSTSDRGVHRPASASPTTVSPALASPDVINFPRGATLAVLLVVPVLGVLLAGRAAAAAPGTGPPAGPSTVVALGDSAASGEGAGDYEPGTRGEAGDWCHRSPAAYVHHAGLGERSVNLACSGAASRDVRFGSGAHHTEGSQAARLAALAATQRVRTVTLQVGANDAPALGDVAVACIRTFVDPTVGPCRETVGGKWEARVAAMVPEVEGAVADVRAAMRGAGYTEADYVLVLLSYGSPVTERMDALHGARGCPFSRPDAGWTRTVAFPRLSAALAPIAARAGARFLDLSRATEGREACSRSSPAEEWQRRLTVDARALVDDRLDAPGRHLFQESFHPRAAGHAEIGRCLGEFVRGGAPRAVCLATADGTLHPSVPAVTA
ncbi:GDSL-type esterase/lipase family protein [Pseudonocardia benzenivorans]|uniref:SGNH hydrolase-type esterase domain-containing protein n=1 Tax=Pseudonocardia dioxanivorans (strain ATCC 55486 / DSM 44775 / JCM 13855 / CB1190) TaxID=675635 RepID=F4CVY6_PSEUX|nr:hypothetical protein Psed_3281 [Pseudonocardia dioxanivorans CB1190]